MLNEPADDKLGLPGFGKDTHPSASDRPSSAPEQSESQLMASPSATGRYSKVRPHALGGLGQVFVALDEELNRHVALKQIQDRFAVDPEARQRFILEAEITGGLEHPGIVPVYGLGMQADGQPYYAMRFIRGESLQDAISLLHNSQLSQNDKMFALRKLLGRLVDVCQAVGYAHSRGVLHRDIKPDNIMLGKFGETLVVDWGLAKLVDSTTEQVESKIKSSSAAVADEAVIKKHLTGSPQDSSSEATIDEEMPLLRPSSVHVEGTRQGRIVGTLSYMSPEQACGDIALIDKRSDIYSLGATMYAMLVGKTALGTKHRDCPLSLDEALSLVRENKFLPPRQIAPWLPKSLAAICERAMATNPDDRYDSTLALADDLERWLADEPVQAYQENALERSRRWIKRHQTLASTSAAILLVGLFALIGFLLLLQDRNRRLAVMTQSLQRANQELTLAEAKAVEEAATAQAVTNFLNQDLLSQASINDHPNPRLEVRAVLQRAASSVDDQFNDQPMVKAQLLKTVGIAFEYLGEYTKAESALRESLALFKRHVGDDKRTTLEVTAALGSVSQALGKYDEALNYLHSVLERVETEFGPKDLLTLETQRKLADLYTVQNRFDEAEKLYQKAIAGQREVLGPNHTETLASERGLVYLMINTSQFDKSLQMARDLYQRSLAALGPDHLVTIESQFVLAQRLQLTEQIAESRALVDDLLPRAQRLLGEQHPSALIVKALRIETDSSLGDYESALKELRQLSEQMRAIYGPRHREVVMVDASVGVMLQEMGQLDEAESTLQATLAIALECLGDDNYDTHYIRLILASTLVANNQPEKAKELLQKIITADVKRGQRSSNTVASAKVLLASVFHDEGDHERALNAATDALKDYTAISSEIGMSDRVRATNIVLWSLVKLDRVDLAEKMLQQIEGGVDSKDHDIAWSLITLADVYIDNENLPKAEVFLSRLSEWSDSLLNPNAEQARVLLDFSATLSGLERWEQAIEVCNKAVKGLEVALGTEHAIVWAAMDQLAIMHSLNGDLDAAQAVFTQLAELHAKVHGPYDPRTASVLDKLTDVLWDAEKKKEAIPWLQQLRQSLVTNKAPDEQVAVIDSYLAECYMEIADYSNAVSSYQSCIELLQLKEGDEDADQLYTLHQFAFCLSRVNKLQQSIVVYRRVVRQRSRVLGADHPFTLLSFGNLAEVSARLINQPNLEDSEIVREAKLDLIALGDRLQSLSPADDGVASAAASLGFAYKSIGNASASALWYQIAADGRLRTLGSEDPLTLTTQHQLAVAMIAAGETDKAIEQLNHVLLAREALLGKNHPDSCDSLHELAQATSVKELELAGAQFEELLRRHTEVSGDTSPNLLKPLVGLGLVRHQQGKVRDAILHYRRCLEIAYRGLSTVPGSADNSEAQAVVGLLLIALADAELADNRLEDAELHVSDGLKLIEKSSLHLWARWRAKGIQGGIHLARGNVATAQMLLREAYENLNQSHLGLSAPFRKWFLKQTVQRLIEASRTANLPSEIEYWSKLLP